MTEYIKSVFRKTYLNPVYPNSFPDPFVLKFRGEYYAFCTGFWHDDRVFGVLRSRDLVSWTEIGGAMEPLEAGPPFYWAPEVTYSNGKFYLYYSAGNETFMEIRVATAERPGGPFVDSGKRLTTEDFAIDAHLFSDADGRKYMFYATDFLEHTHIGTGTVVDRMIDFFTLEGRPRPVTRAKYDWQVYDPQRREKGGVRWHTVEGAFVLKRKGIYYEMFSGGNWQNPTYGVSFAVTDDIESAEEWRQFSDGEKILPILRTLHGKIVGPGHNSVIRGPNNRELFCVYHRWTDGGRVLAIDRMDFAGGARLFIRGATDTPQPAPFAPQVRDFFDEFSDENWKIVSGSWKTENNSMISGRSGSAELACRKGAESFLLETSLRLVEGESGRFGVHLTGGGNKIVKLLFEPAAKKITLARLENEREEKELLNLPADFDFQAFHLLRIESDLSAVKVSLDEQVIFLRQDLEKIPRGFSFAAEDCRAAFSGAALTAGFENLFENSDPEPAGWRKIFGRADCRIADRNFIVTNRDDVKTIFRKRFSGQNYELAVNFRLIDIFDDGFEFGFYPVFDETEETPFFSVKRHDQVWVLNVETADGSRQFDLPEDFSPDVFHQIAFLRLAGKVFVRLETEIVGSVDISRDASEVAFCIRNAAAAFDMIRVTAL